MFDTIGNVLLGAASSLIGPRIEQALTKNATGPTKARIDAKITELTCVVVEPLSEYLKKEGVQSQIVVQIVESVKASILEFMTDNNKAMELGLDTSRIAGTISENLKGDAAIGLSRAYPTQYDIVLRAFVQLTVQIPSLFCTWETMKFQIQFKQIDDLRDSLDEAFKTLENVSVATQRDGTLLKNICDHKAITDALKLEIHGLRNAAIPSAEAEKLFVQPCLSEMNPNQIQTDFDSVLTRYERYSDLIGELDAGSQILVRADAGGGKTTYAKWLCSKFLKENPPRMGVFVELRSLTNFKDVPSLLELVKTKFTTTKSFTEQIDSPILRDWCKVGQIIVILDGFDEISEINRDSAIIWIDGLQQAYPGVIQLITSRNLSTKHAVNLIQNGWRNFSIQPFDPPRVEEYISRFQSHGPGIQTGATVVNANTLARQWEADPTISPLTRNPLLLSTLLVVHHMDGELPDDRSNLYKRYVDGMLGLWESKKKLIPHRTPLTKEQKKRSLQIIAINMISDEIDAVGEEKVGQWLESYIQEEKITGHVSGVLEHLRERSGLLIGPGQYSFAHKTIGEYLVAESCMDGIQRDISGRRFDRKLIEKNSSTDRWNTVLFLWAGLAPINDVQEFVEAMIGQEEYKLASGILLDRRKRLDNSWMRSVLLKLLIGIDSTLDTDLSWGISLIPLDKKFDIEEVPFECFRCYQSDFEQFHFSYKIRNLGHGFVGLRELLSEMYKLGVFTAEDFADEVERFSDLLWVDYHFASEFSCMKFVNFSDHAGRKLAFIHYFAMNPCKGPAQKQALDMISHRENFEKARASLCCDLLQRIGYVSEDKCFNILQLYTEDSIFTSLLSADRPQAEFTSDIVREYVPISGDRYTYYGRNEGQPNFGEALVDQISLVEARVDLFENGEISSGLSKLLGSVRRIAERYHFDSTIKTE